jgi:hypothetical protein
MPKSSSLKKLHELLEEYSEFSKEPLSERMANNLCKQSWHLTDWVFNEFIYSASNLKSRDQQIGDWRNTLYPRCPSIKIIHDLAQESKHSIVTRPKDFVESIGTVESTFDYTFDFTFNDSKLVIIMQNGDSLNFRNTIAEVIDFWKSLFNSDLNLSV